MSSPRDGQVFPLAADSKTLDDLLVAPLVARFDVIEEPAPGVVAVTEHESAEMTPSISTDVKPKPGEDISPAASSP